jgi:hypothetical protein
VLLKREHQEPSHLFPCEEAFLLLRHVQSIRRFQSQEVRIKVKVWIETLAFLRRWDVLKDSSVMAVNRKGCTHPSTLHAGITPF